MNASHEAEQRAELIRDALYLMQRSKLPEGHLPIAILSREQAHSILISTIDRAEKIGFQRANAHHLETTIRNLKATKDSRVLRFLLRNQKIVVATTTIAVGLGLFLGTTFRVNPIEASIALLIVGLGWIILRDRGETTIDN